MARFKNVSGVFQQIYLPSTHLRENRWWDDAAPKKVLSPDEVLETTLEGDAEYLRGLTHGRTVRVQSAWLRRAGDEKKKLPGVLIELT